PNGRSCPFDHAQFPASQGPARPAGCDRRADLRQQCTDSSQTYSRADRMAPMSKHPDPRANSMVCPRHLSEEIVAGNCVAFVGAGFSAAARLPAWTELLRELAGEVGESLRRAIEGALDRDTGADGRYL